MLTNIDLKILNQLSKCRKAAFAYGAKGTQHTGTYILIADFPEEQSAGALDYDDTVPRIVPSNVIQKLYNLGILKRKKRVGVFSYVYTINHRKLKDFEQLKEISVQIALGTWFQLSENELNDLMDEPG